MTVNINSRNIKGFLLLAAPFVAMGQNMRSTPTYRVRAPVRKLELEKTQFDPLDLMLSFSDDGAEREDEFYLDLFDTPALLTNAESPMVISDAMNSFLLAELNGKFGYINSVEKVSSEIVNLSDRKGIYTNSSGIADARVGTEARMKVTLSFELTPSPKSEDVVDLLKIIMSNLTYFVTNLTNSVSDDHELSGVYEAIRREIRRPVLVQPPDQNIVVDISEPADQNPKIVQPSNKMVFAAVPVVLVVAVLAAVIVFFVFKKKRKPTQAETDKDSVMMHMDVENDVYSVDRSVESTDTSKAPNSMPDSMKLEESSINYSMSVDSGLLPGTPKGGDSVFSGIDTAFTGSVLSPKSVSSPKSMMTGFTCASASTIRASNVNNNQIKSKSPTGGSVFAFLDPIEDTEEEDIENFELMERGQPSVNLSSSQDTDENAYSGNTAESIGDTESSSSSSLEGVSISLPVKSNKNKEASTEPVSHVLADLENMEATIASTPRDPTPPTTLTREAPDDDKNNAEENEKSAGSLSSMASNLMGGLFKGKRKSMSTPNSPTSAAPKGGTRSAPGSPLNEVGRHWMATNKMQLKIPTSPKFESDDDYDMNLSNPSLSGEDYESSRGFDDSINDSMKIVDQPPQDRPDQYISGGRRHAGDKIGGDGSALYQASAMHPTDWSCKSSDADSVGTSTIDDEVSQNQRSQMNQGKATNGNRQLINDLVWLEKKIATVRGESTARKTEIGDSLSYASNDNHDGMETSNDESYTYDRDPSNIVCRDCIAPPGKLRIIIHSTKDGPAVHTVKEGSCLEGEVFSGDLIISVDNVDTRTCTAEEVMKMMASKSNQERKITVLHFEEES